MIPRCDYTYYKAFWKHSKTQKLGHWKKQGLFWLCFFPPGAERLGQKQDRGSSLEPQSQWHITGFSRDFLVVTLTGWGVEPKLWAIYILKSLCFLLLSQNLWWLIHFSDCIGFFSRQRNGCWMMWIVLGNSEIPRALCLLKWSSQSLESDFPWEFCRFVPLNSIFDTVLSEFSELWDGASCRPWRSQTRALENHSWAKPIRACPAHFCQQLRSMLHFVYGLHLNHLHSNWSMLDRLVVGFNGPELGAGNFKKNYRDIRSWKWR